MAQTIDDTYYLYSVLTASSFRVQETDKMYVEKVNIT